MRNTYFKEENAMKITYFINVRSKVCESMSLEQFIERTRNGTWQRITEEYRQALADGNEQRATRLGHSAANLVQLSGLVDIDIDKCSERIEEIRELLHRLPYVVYTQISPSNNGVKCLARVSISQASQYTPLFRLITTHISNHIQFPCDMQCSDVSRLQFVCHDPTVYYRPDAITFQEHLDLEGELPVELTATCHTGTNRCNSSAGQRNRTGGTRRGTPRNSLFAGTPKRVHAALGTAHTSKGFFTRRSGENDFLSR